MDQMPYGLRAGHGVASVVTTGLGGGGRGTLSDQKTPGRHPNSFLYRAHLNLNEEWKANEAVL